MPRRKVETGILWGNVRKSLDAEPWEVDPDDDDQEIRTVWLGTVFGVTPSGKYYQPFACSNLDPCPQCGGRGRVEFYVPKRIRKRYVRRLEKMERRATLIITQCRTENRDLQPIRNYNTNIFNPIRERLIKMATGAMQCGRCGGYGSHEAWDDEVWNEMLEQEASDRDLFVTHNEDGDYLIGECRPREKEDELPTEPDEEDWVTDDYILFYQHGHSSTRFEVGDYGDNWIDAVKARMDADQFWPNVWYLGERGDWNLLDLETGTFAD